jgi:hypothetical protein
MAAVNAFRCAAMPATFPSNEQPCNPVRRPFRLPALAYGSTIQPVSLHRENDNDNEVPGRHTASAGVDIGAFQLTGFGAEYPSRVAC